MQKMEKLRVLIFSANGLFVAYKCFYITYLMFCVHFRSIWFKKSPENILPPRRIYRRFYRRIPFLPPFLPPFPGFSNTRFNPVGSTFFSGMSILMEGLNFRTSWYDRFRGSIKF